MKEGRRERASKIERKGNKEIWRMNEREKDKEREK